MQQAVMAEQAAYEPTFSYDEVFPALPQSTSNTPGPQGNPLGQWNQKMRIGSSVVTQVFRVPFEERKQDQSDRFGEGESNRTCMQIMKETGAIIEISTSKDQTLTFLVTGKQNEVLDARRKIYIHFQTQAQTSISIPKEHHRFILGKSGQRLKDLEKQTATKIHVPNQGDPSDKITVTGTKDGIEKAVHEIKVTSDEQSKQACEKVSVPKIYHPFVYGPFNEGLIALTSETGVRINIPPLSVMKDEIVITGEKEGVMLAKERIQAIHNEMEKKCALVSVEVPKSQHKYVIGPRGSTIAEILQETGVSVEMPPSDSPKDTITLRGPQDKLGHALNMVYAKANSIQTVTVEAPNWIHKYIIGRKGANIKKITQDLSKVHVEFTEKEDRIKIEGPPEEVSKAQEDLQKMTKELVDKLTFTEIQVDPKFYKHIIGKNGANVNRLKDELEVTINISENDGRNIIRIEGSKEGVDTTKQKLTDMVNKLENEKEKDVIIEQRFYKNIIGSKGEKIREIKDKFNQVLITFPGPGEKRDVVKIRGPKEDVDKCHKHLMKLVKELNESSYQVELPIFKQFHKFIIGKAGANIRKIRDETNTKIDLPAEGEKSDVIVITGKKENCLDAKDRIQKIQNELANIVSEEISINPKFYNTLIGAGGKLIHAIMEECGGVAIKFPPAETNSDKVSVRGPKEDVTKAIEQLREHISELQLASFSAEVRAKPQHHKFLIGKNGSNIRKIRDLTGARIIFPSEKDSDKEAITILGRQEAVEQARAELEATIKEIDNIVEAEMQVDPRHHRHFVARRGEILHKLSDEFGGVLISFPRPNAQPSDKVTLKGSKECIEFAKQRILEIVKDLESQITIEVVIPQEHHRTVMGAKGSKVQGITAEYDVQIKFPDRDACGEYEGAAATQMNGGGEGGIVRQCDVIRITGKQEQCDLAKQALLDLVPITIEVPVPFDMHGSIIGQRGRGVKELMDRYDVHISLAPAEERKDTVFIHGAPKCVEEAKLAVEDRVEQLELERQDRLLKSFELKMEVDPDYHPKIIGRKGLVISKIRQDYDVQITLPKKGDPDQRMITITGYEDNAQKAKEHIEQIVQKLNDLLKEEVQIDSRVHSRLIGSYGRNIRKIMDQYQVDIKFPRPTDSNPDLVVISGTEEAIADARDHLLNLEEEFLQDVHDNEMRQSYRPIYGRQEENGTSGDLLGGGTGFVVKGAPWEQQQSAPDTASTSEFPSFGTSSSVPIETPPTSTAWGPRR